MNGTGVGANGALINNSGTAATIGSGIAGLQVASVTGTGSVYSTAPSVTISGTGSGATAVATLGVTAASFSVNVGDKVYTVAPTVTISGPQSYASLIASAGRTNLNSSLSNATITDAAGAILNVNANASGSTVNVSGNTVFTVSQNLVALNIGTGGVVTVGLPALAEAPKIFAASGGLIDAAENATQAVPEPGSLVLIALGALGLLGLRRSIK